MTNRNRKVGFLIVWIVLLIVVLAVQLGYQRQLDQRGLWMIEVDAKLASHERKLDILSESLAKLPDAMLERFLEVYKK